MNEDNIPLEDILNNNIVKIKDTETKMIIMIFILIKRFDLIQNATRTF